jgi:hypothetical protein
VQTEPWWQTHLPKHGLLKFNQYIKFRYAAITVLQITVVGRQSTAIVSCSQCSIMLLVTYVQPQTTVDALITSKTVAHYCCHACQSFIAVLQAASAAATQTQRSHKYTAIKADEMRAMTLLLL